MKSQTANDVLIFKEVRGHRPPLQSEGQRDRWSPVVEKREILSSPKIAMIWAVVAVVGLIMNIGGIELAKWLVGLFR